MNNEMGLAEAGIRKGLYWWFVFSAWAFMAWVGIDTGLEISGNWHPIAAAGVFALIAIAVKP